MEIRRYGERGLIRLIRSVYDYSWEDSDAARIEIGNRYLLITNDSITKATHIPDSASPEAVGYFFAAINLSDIAACGGTPKYFMSSLILPKATDSRYLIGMEVGIRECLNRYNVKVIGGDFKEGKELAMTGIAIGEVDKALAMERKNFKAGDVLCVTGSLGSNAAGYYMWKNGKKEGAKALLGVEPRIKEGIFLSKNGVRAGIDLSDGVYSAISRISTIAGVGFEIHYDRLPISASASKVHARYGISTEQLCLNFGGEYELLFSISEPEFESLRRKAARNGIAINMIGKVTENGNVLIKDGAKRVIRYCGYEHFRS